MKIKKCIVLFFCIFIMLFSIFSYLPLNADSVNITYHPFTHLIYCSDIVDLYHVEVVVYAEISDGIMIMNGSVSRDEWELNAENTHSNGSYFNEGYVYLVKYNGSYIDVNYVILYDDYLGQYYDNGYWSGYGVALDSNEQQIYQSGLDRGQSLGYALGEQSGYESGYADGQSLYAYGSQGYNNIYNAGKDDGYQQGLQEQIDDDVETTPSFYKMLRQIARYPVEMFTGRYNEETHQYEGGLNIDIFGVNIGGFLLGIGIVAIIFGIIRKIKGF